MILYGPNTEIQASTLTKSQAGLTISQLLQYNSYHRRPTNKSSSSGTHAKRAAYQAGDRWGQALVSSPVLPDPQEWGWTLDEGIWKPFCTTFTRSRKQ